MSAVAHIDVPGEHLTTPRRDDSNRNSRRGASPWAIVAVTCISVLGVAAIVSTYPVFTQTSDEPAHIACGLQLLTFDRYDYEPQHPPLARVMAALPLFLTGARADDHTKMWTEGNSALARNGEYQKNLTLARLGILPFFVLACVFVYRLASQFYSPLVAAATVALFASLPLVLAHAALATTDMAVTAAFAMAVDALLRWQAGPRWSSSLWLGATIAVGLLTKFSFIPFFAITTAIFLLGRPNAGQQRSWRLDGSFFRQCGSALALCWLLIWAGYGFRIAHLPVADPAAHPIRVAMGSIPLPLTDFARGIVQLGHHFRLGHPSYLLGRTSMHGFALFFPIALAVKTPLPFLFLAVVGSVIALLRWRERAFRAVALAAIASVAILICCIPSTITIGLRHLLPMMVLLSLVAVCPLMLALESHEQRRPLIGALVAVLIVAQVVAVWRQGPDYLSYFNVLAGSKPEFILVDSDLDWGQDLGRLQAFCSRNHIARLTLGYFGSADIHQLRNVEVTTLAPDARATGWVAISKSTRHLSMSAPGIPGTGREYSWLDSYTPRAQVGSSIDVYFIPEVR